MGAQTAGDKKLAENGKENQFWCRNPQYFLNITEPTHLKIILKRRVAVESVVSLLVSL